MIYLMWHLVSRELLVQFYSLGSNRGRRVRFERRHRGKLEAWRLQRADWVLASWGKSGRTWLRTMISRYYKLHFDLRGDPLLGFDNLHLRNRFIPRVFFTHCNYLKDYTGHSDGIRDYCDKKTVLLVRDPRDVAVSQFFQWRFRMSSRKKLINGYPEADDTDIFAFVLHERQGLMAIVEFMNCWARSASIHKDLLFIRYEDIRSDPRRELQRLLEFTNMTISPEHVEGAVEYASFGNMRKLEQGNVFRWHGSKMRSGDPHNPQSFKVRQGVIGGYRQHFTTEQLQRIDEMVKQNLNPVFGYGDLP